MLDIARAGLIGAGTALGLLVSMPAEARAQTTLTGCYVPNSGTVYRIRAAGLPDDCRNNQHVEFTWSLQGPAGPAGPQGLTGPQGPAGPAGGLSITGVEVTSRFTAGAIPAGGFGFVEATCPAGKVATGAGGLSGNPAVRIRLADSSPRVTNGIVVGWAMFLENPGPVAVNGEIQVVCVPAQ